MKLIEARLNKRASEGADASDADIAVMKEQIQHLQPLTPEEQELAVSVNTDDDDAISRLLEQLRLQELVY